MAQAARDENFVPTLLAVSSADGVTPIAVYADPITHRLLVDVAGGVGTVTSVSVVTANGFAGTVATATSTPAITLTTTITGILKGNGTAISAVTIGSGLSYDGTTLSATASGITIGTTTITSGTNTRILYNNAGVVGEYTLSGSGTVVAMATSPTFDTSITGSYLTASEILITDASKNIVSAAVATYPSLTELTYVKGVTSAIQTQLNAKQATLSGAALTAVTVATDDKVLIQDTSDADNLKTVTVSSIVALASGGITIGTTSITGGTNTRILYNNSGVVGEYTLTGSGTVVAMQTAPTFATSITTPSVLATANDSGALGASGTAFSDLFLASGAVINFNAGNVALTHSAGILTQTAGELRVTSANVGTNADSVPTLSSTSTFTNKTLTSPRIGTNILDTNGNELLVLTATASAVNEITLANAATANNPKLTASGGDTNIGFDFQAKGTGTYRLLGTSSQAAELRLYEDTDAGTNYTAFKVGTQSADITYTLPTDDGDSGQVLTTDGSGVLDWATVSGGGSITTLTPTPINGGITGASSDSQFNATTRQYMYMFNVPASITVNKISIKTGGTTTTDVAWDITIYTADGQTKAIEVTTATITTSDTIYATAVSSVTLTPGNYYFAINTGGATGDCNFYTWTSATNQALGNSVSLATDVASEPKLMGYATITAGTPSATFDPAAITEDTLTNGAVIFRLDN